MVKSRRPDKTNTLDAVAAAAGVSTMTVSRVMRGKDNVSQKTRDRVQAAAEQLGYVHNRLAGSLASSQTTQIAVILPSMRNIVFPEVLTGITDALHDTGFQPVVGITDYDLARECDLVRAMLAWRPAGIIIANTWHTAETRRLLGRAGIPIVETMELTKDPIDMCVGLDHDAVGRASARYALAKGHKRFAYLGADHRLDLTAKSRFAAFSAEVSSAGGAFGEVLTVPEPSGISLGRHNIERLLELADRVDAVYFSNDTVAAGAMMGCLRAGIRIPQDLAILGFSGLEIAQAMPVTITTVRSPRYEMGRESAERILARLAGEDVSPILDAGFEMIAGESC